MNRIFVNDMFRGERRIAVVYDQKFVFFEYEHAYDQRRKGNMYSAVVESVEEALEAGFVNYGTEQRGFLPFKEVADNYRKTTAKKSAAKEGDDKKAKKTPPIKIGQKMLVQVEHDERDNKGAALTTRVTLAGSYWVLSPNNPKADGISRRISGAQREEMRKKLEQLDVPEGMGIIMRTAGIGRSIEELRWDLDCLLNLWQSIQQATDENPAPCLIYREDDALFRTIRDNLRHDIDEIVVDNEETFNFINSYIKDTCPDFADKVTHYKSHVPLFTHYQLEEQINALHEKDVPLPSGGRLVFDKGEALTAIDVNSASTKGSDIEATALQTNLEAADEIARQLRLRDIGGLVVIDFIDMTSKRNRDAVEKRMEKAVANDRARIQTTGISRLGLFEMSRQRITSSVAEQGLSECPHCHGTGSVRSVELFSSTVLRAIEEQAIHSQSASLQVQLPLAVATYIINEKRDIIQDIEARQKVSIIVIPNPHFEMPKYQIKRTRRKPDGGDDASYQIPFTSAPDGTDITESWQQPTNERAIVSRQQVCQPSSKSNKPGLIKRLWSSIQTEAEDTAGEEKPKKPVRRQSSPTRRRSSGTQTRSGNTRSRSGERSGNRSGGRNANRTRSRGPANRQSSRGNKPDVNDENIGNRIVQTVEPEIDDNIGNRIEEPANKRGSRRGQSNQRGGRRRSANAEGGNAAPRNRRRSSGNSGGQRRRNPQTGQPFTDQMHDDLESL